ncbi:succinyl-diaminopimelate desuccinylase [Secundilactobacillus oryzae JCM 18671]|uniref:Probable succinyl-diaminopimelate desuccinylase n=1 Tax=Secundilactobacillus oryzae JCM 18671 TaxID=1291743 RepID=A0A081BGV8_9LACO|nr:ArgE/DapE family deacylase [Secundilactobacillus oryzae]GAK47276.1 succinyl-diaminopimelate desuccinylase [Secundilactobacillus oryzae JCM 18671]
MTEQEKIEILQHIIKIKSVNDNETEVADYIASLFAPYPNAKVEKVNYAPNRDNLVVTIGQPDRKRLGFSGHMDVVDPGDLSKWTHEPFGAEVADGKLFGRGASDMKTGLTAQVIAMLEFLESGTELPGEIRLLATVGEETGEYGAATLTDQGYADNLAGLVISEPSGLNEITYTARGVIDYKIESVGKASHSARPEFGINAIDNLLVYYNEIQKVMAPFDKVNPILGGVLHNVDLISGGEQINSIPAKAWLMANMRTIPEYPNQVFYDAIEKLVDELNQRPGFDLKVSYSFPEEAIPGKPDTPLVKLAQKVSKEVLGTAAKPVGSGGANDGAEFLRAKGDFTSIVYGPGSNTSHMPDEYVELSDFLKSIDLYKQLALEFLA